MDKPLKPFDVISSPYVSLDGSVKTNPSGDAQRALFMVLSVDYDNLICAKITSQRNDEYLGHSFMLSKAANPFLKVDSFVQLDKLHTLSVSSVSFIGYVDKPSRYDIYLILQGFFVSIADGLRRFCQRYSNGYSSPNRRQGG